MTCRAGVVRHRWPSSATGNQATSLPVQEGLPARLDTIGQQLGTSLRPALEHELGLTRPPPAPEGAPAPGGEGLGHHREAGHGHGVAGTGLETGGGVVVDPALFWLKFDPEVPAEQ